MKSKHKEFNEIITSFKTYLQQEYETGLKTIKTVLPPSREEYLLSREIPLQNQNIVQANNLESLYNQTKKCTKCSLSKTRINLVFGAGNPKAKLMFVGEGPGFNEDRAAKPFIGRAGQLLTRIIQAIGLSREEVYITNIVKCHPLKNPHLPEKRGNDRPPTEQEIKCCYPILEEQIKIIKPKIICALGNTASQTLLNTKSGMKTLRGRFYHLFSQIIVTPTYHPAALLRNPSLKRDVWEDMKMIKRELKL